jgi:hypothetical protein
MILSKVKSTAIFKSLIIGCIFFLLMGCTPTMTVKMDIAPSSLSKKNQQLTNRNILVLIMQGQTNKQFASAAPNSLGTAVINNPMNFQLFHGIEKGGQYKFKKDVDKDKPISIYVLGSGLSYDGASQWKYYFNKLDTDTLNLSISSKGVITKDHASSWF